LVRQKEDAVSRNTSVALGQHFADFIDAQVQAGRYSTASDVLRAALRLLEEHEARVKALQDALNAGRQSGEPRVFDSEAFLSRRHAQHRQAPAARSTNGRTPIDIGDGKAAQPQ